VHQTARARRRDREPGGGTETLFFALEDPVQDCKARRPGEGSGDRLGFNRGTMWRMGGGKKGAKRKAVNLDSGGRQSGDQSLCQ